ncbi:MAG: PSD1 and planctomycete cytochrome C domain-containing protein [Pirellulaceae bacterium]
MRAADQPAPIDFNRDVRSVLSDNCFHCHGPDEETRQADLRLDVKQGVLGGDQPGVVVPGKSEQSELIRRLTSDDELERMPPPDSNRKLTPQQIAKLKQWVESGAQWEEHWAFVTPMRPRLPEVQDASWSRNPIDRFLLARLEQEKLTPSPEASRETLVRRVTLDLTGLPPTPREVDAFLADDSPDAYERLVDRLLASPRYGERMVWDWLDAARYADTNGYQGDPERTMWPWRDWVIDAMNQNMPFDQFTIEQLAGDLLTPFSSGDKSAEDLDRKSLSRLIASGFNRNHMFNGEGGRIPEETRVENVMDRTETTGAIWLGVTIGCCRCHDHKYDPFTQREYYQLYAFFNNTSEEGRGGGGRSGQIAPAVSVTSAADEARLDEFAQQIARRAGELEAFESVFFATSEGQSVAESPKAKELDSKLVAVLRQPPLKRGSGALDELHKGLKEKEPEYAAKIARLKQAIDQRDAYRDRLPRVMVMDEREQPRETFMLVRGTYNKPADKVTAGVPAILPPLPEDDDVNRLALARWLVDPRHPLTARVTVNRYWQTLFGVGLVKTVEDFGSQGEKPSHPELLDWLATEFVESGWDVKRLHRLITTSAAYRQSSRVSPQLVERDPDNRLLARGPRFRLPSWMLRDQALAVSGLLSGKLGGEAVKPYQPEGIWAEATFGKKKYVQDHGESLYRRSVYTFWRRIVGPTMFFDTASRQVCTVKQVRTNTPLHALVTLNETTYVEAARALAEVVLTGDAKDDPRRIDEIFLRLVARRPSDAERKILLSRLATLRKQFADDRDAAEKLLAVGESPRDPSLDAVQHAAYTALCTLLLNLDETLTKQ